MICYYIDSQTNDRLIDDCVIYNGDGDDMVIVKVYMLKYYILKGLLSYLNPMV